MWLVWNNFYKRGINQTISNIFETIYKIIAKKWSYILCETLKLSGLNPRGEMNLSPHKKNSK